MMYLALAEEAMANKAVIDESNMIMSNQMYQDFLDGYTEGL